MKELVIDGQAIVEIAPEPLRFLKPGGVCWIPVRLANGTNRVLFAQKMKNDAIAYTVVRSDNKVADEFIFHSSVMPHVEIPRVGDTSMAETWVRHNGEEFYVELYPSCSEGKLLFHASHPSRHEWPSAA